MGYKNKALHISVLKKNNLSCKTHFITSHRSEPKAAAAERDGTKGFFFRASISGRHLKTKPAEARACTVFSQHYSLCAEAYLGLEQGVCKLSTGEKKNDFHKGGIHNLARGGSTLSSITSTSGWTFQVEQHIHQPLL